MLYNKSTTNPQQIHNKSKCCTTSPQQVHNKSNKWSLTLSNAADDGRAALNILIGHYAGKGKPCAISYTEPTSVQKKSLQKKPSASVTDYVYIIQAMTAAVGLRNAGEIVSDSLLIDTVVKGLEEYIEAICLTKFKHSANLKPPCAASTDQSVTSTSALRVDQVFNGVLATSESVTSVSQSVSVKVCPASHRKIAKTWQRRHLDKLCTRYGTVWFSSSFIF